MQMVKNVILPEFLYNHYLLVFFVPIGRALVTDISNQSIGTFSVRSMIMFTLAQGKYCTFYNNKCCTFILFSCLFYSCVCVFVFCSYLLLFTLILGYFFFASDSKSKTLFACEIFICMLCKGRTDSCCTLQF